MFYIDMMLLNVLSTNTKGEWELLFMACHTIMLSFDPICHMWIHTERCYSPGRHHTCKQISAVWRQNLLLSQNTRECYSLSQVTLSEYYCSCSSGANKWFQMICSYSSGHICFDLWQQRYQLICHSCPYNTSILVSIFTRWVSKRVSFDRCCQYWSTINISNMHSCSPKWQ